MKAVINVVLLVCTVVMAYVCFDSIRTPVRFDRARALRESAVKARLLDIRKAQSAYYLMHGRRYTASFDTLIAFVQTGRLPVSYREEGENKDTFWIALRDTLYPKGFQPDSLRYIPYGKGAQFEMEVLGKLSSSGLSYCLLEVRAPGDTYLDGLDRRSILAWKDLQEQQGRYAGLKIGDLEMPNNNAGNWE